MPARRQKFTPNDHREHRSSRGRAEFYRIRRQRRIRLKKTLFCIYESELREELMSIEKGGADALVQLKGLIKELIEQHGAARVKEAIESLFGEGLPLPEGKRGGA